MESELLSGAAEARIQARSLRVSSWERIRAFIIEKFPEPHRIKKWTQCYLILEAILCIYLLICLIRIDQYEETKESPN